MTCPGHSLRSTSVREQLAAASGGTALAAAATPSPGPAQGRSIFGRLGIRKPSILSLTSPHAGGGNNSGGYSPATARTFSLDDLLKPPPRRKAPKPLLCFFSRVLSLICLFLSLDLPNFHYRNLFCCSKVQNITNEQNTVVNILSDS